MTGPDTPGLHVPQSAKLPPASGYAQAVIVPGAGIALISGQVGIDRNWTLADGISAQADRAFANLGQAVAACGSTLDDIAKLTVFVTDPSYLQPYCDARERFFQGTGHRPASSFVAVAGLYDPAALIEIEAIVAVRNAGA